MYLIYRACAKFVKLVIRAMYKCREREGAHANHQTLQGEFDDRHKKHKARCAPSIILLSMLPDKTLKCLSV